MMISSLDDLRLALYLQQLQQLVGLLWLLETQPLAFEQLPLLLEDYFVVVKLLQRQRQPRLLEMDWRADSIVYPEGDFVASINSE